MARSRHWYFPNAKILLYYAHLATENIILAISFSWLACYVSVHRCTECKPSLLCNINENPRFLVPLLRQFIPPNKQVYLNETIRLT